MRLASTCQSKIKEQWTWGMDGGGTRRMWITNFWLLLTSECIAKNKLRGNLAHDLVCNPPRSRPSTINTTGMIAWLRRERARGLLLHLPGQSARGCVFVVRPPNRKPDFAFSTQDHKEHCGRERFVSNDGESSKKYFQFDGGNAYVCQ